MYWLKTFLRPTHSLCYLHLQPWRFQNKLSLYHWYVSSNFMGIPWYSLGGYLAFDWMAIWCLPHETIQWKHPTELLESAKIDGCGEIRTFWSVAFPIIETRICSPCNLHLSSIHGTTTSCSWLCWLHVTIWPFHSVLRLCRLKWQPTMVWSWQELPCSCTQS